MAETLASYNLHRGSSRDVPLQVQDGAGVAVAGFLGTDTLAAKLTRGEDLAPDATLSAAWTDATNAKYTVTFNDADTASLAPGLYFVFVTAARGGRTSTIGKFRVELLASPGTATAPLAFTTYDDLTKYCPWLARLQDDAGAKLDYLEHQARATNRLIDALVSLWKPRGLSTMPFASGARGYFSPADPRSPSRWLREQLIPLAVGSTPPASMPYRLATPANYADPTLSTALLLYDEVKEVCALWSVAAAFRGQVGRESKTGGRDWGRLASEYSGEASSLFRSRRFELDLANPQTGDAGITIDGGNTSLR